jgi:uncharacterized protein involved in exopolysaccharide biosynthesis
MPETKNPITQLTSLRDDTIQWASKNPAAARVLTSANQVREWADDVSKKLRGLDALEVRVNSLEKRVAAMEKRARRAAKAAPETSAGGGTAAPRSTKPS